jgi:hypothetical protein
MGWREVPMIVRVQIEQQEYNGGRRRRACEQGKEGGKKNLACVCHREKQKSLKRSAGVIAYVVEDVGGKMIWRKEKKRATWLKGEGRNLGKRRKIIRKRIPLLRNKLH